MFIVLWMAATLCKCSSYLKFARLSAENTLDSNINILGSGTMDVFQHRYWQISACCSIHLYKVLQTLTVPRLKIIHCLFLFNFLPNWGSPQASTSRPWECRTATTTSFASGPFSRVSSSTYKSLWLIERPRLMGRWVGACIKPGAVCRLSST